MQGCVAPHPPLLVPEVGRGHLDQVQATVDGMGRLGVALGERETIVIVSPHAPLNRSTFTVKSSPTVVGDLSRFGAGSVKQVFETDTELVDTLVETARLGDVEVRPVDDPTLDHGVMVPLHFLKTRRLVVLSVVADHAAHRALGTAVRRACETRDRPDVAFVASGDLSHRLLPGAPAGYDEHASAFDRRVVELLSEGDFAALDDLDPGMIDRAGECGLRSLIALGGFLGDDASRNPQIFSYEGPFGVGYLVAGFNLEATA